MNRAERRRAGKKATKAKTVTYNYTKEQLDAVIKAGVMAEIETIKEQVREEAVNTAVTLMLALPMEVLIGEGYWAKSAKKRIPKFLDDVVSLYDSWNKGILTMEELRQDLWEYGGIKLEAPKGTEDM
jgi:hypothetical protein